MFLDHIWLVVWNMNFIFPYIRNNTPNALIFFRGLGSTTNQTCPLAVPLILGAHQGQITRAVLSWPSLWLGYPTFFDGRVQDGAPSYKLVYKPI